MADSRGPFQINSPDRITTQPELPEVPVPPEPSPQRHGRRQRMLVLAGMVALLVIVALVWFLRDDSADPPMPVKDFREAARALRVEPVTRWQTHTLSDGATIQLPARFEAAAIDPDAAYDRAALLFGAELTDELDSARENFQLGGVYIDTEGDLFQSVALNIGSTALPGAFDVQALADDVWDMALGENVVVIDSAVVTLDGRRMARWIVSITFADYTLLDMRMVQYIVLDPDHSRMWAITGMSEDETFEDWLAIFQAAAETFTLSTG